MPAGVPQGQRGGGKQGAQGVLHVTIIAHVETGGWIEVAFVVLVETIGQLPARSFVAVPFGLGASGEIAITVALAGIEIALAEIIAHVAGERPAVVGAKDQAFASLKTVSGGDAVERVFGIAAHIGGIVQAIFVDCGATEGEKLGEPMATGGEEEVLSRVVVAAVAHFPSEFVGSRNLLARDDVDHPAGGITAVERRSGSANDFDAFDIGQVDALEIDIVHRFAGQALAVDEKKHALSGKTAQIEIHIAAQRLGEFETGQFVREYILHVVGVGAANVLSRDHAGLHRAACHGARRARARHHGRIEQRIGAPTLGRRKPLRRSRERGAEATEQKREIQRAEDSHERAEAWAGAK